MPTNTSKTTLKTTLKWTRILIVIQKYMNLFISSIFLAAGLMNVGAKVQLPAWVLLALGLTFLSVAVSLGFLQEGLALRRPWARNVAISIALFAIISIFFPLGLASMIELFRKETRSLFQRSEEKSMTSANLKIKITRVLRSQSVAVYFLVGMIAFFSAANYISERNQTASVAIEASRSGR